MDLMEVDPDDVFRDEDDDPEAEGFLERTTTKELAVYLVDASPKMFSTRCSSAMDEDDAGDGSHFHLTLRSIVEVLKAQIINRSYDEVAICFFNTRERKNIQELNGVFVFNVGDRESLDRPTARLIKELSQLEESFMKEIGSQFGIVAGSRENSLYNALWVAQALLRKGSAKTADKRMLIFTNEDDPFGTIKGAVKADMARTTLQRAKDAQDLGISIELFPLSHADKEFNVSLFYSDLIGIEGDELALFVPMAGDKLEIMKDKLRKRMFKKRMVRRLTLTIADRLSIEVKTYALIRPTVPGKTIWLDSVTNKPLKIERSLICADTGALLKEPPKRFQPYRNKDVLFSLEELSEVKRVSTGHIRILGFKPLSCLKNYHNLRPSTFLFPSDEEVIGSTRTFIALHGSMLRLKRYAVAFYGSPFHAQLVALVAQEEVTDEDGVQNEPPGIHMIHLPYSDDIRPIEEIHSSPSTVAPQANDDQISKAKVLMKRMELKNFSVSQLSNPAVQRHYAVLQALALEEDEMPEFKDETAPDENGMSRPVLLKAVEEFKFSVFGDRYEESRRASNKAGDASKKRKETMDKASEMSAKYNWNGLAESGKLKNLTVAELKYYLAAHSLPLGGKKEDLIKRILTHMQKK